MVSDTCAITADQQPLRRVRLALFSSVFTFEGHSTELLCCSPWHRGRTLMRATAWRTHLEHQDAPLLKTPRACDVKHAKTRT